MLGQIKNLIPSYCLPFLHIWYAEGLDFPDRFSFHLIDISFDICSVLFWYSSGISTATHPVG